MPLTLPEIAAAVQRAQLREFSGTVYRSIAFQVLVSLNCSILDGAHAGQTGGRYNKPNSEPISYFSRTQTLAAFECECAAIALNLHTAMRPPRLTCAVTVSKANVLDLSTDLSLVSIFGGAIDTDELTRPTGEWQHLNRHNTLSITQMIGEAARARPDIDGLLVPSWLIRILSSAIPDVTNLVLFMDPADPKRPRGPRVTLDIHDPTGMIH